MTSVVESNETTTKIRLWGCDDNITSAVKALMFGELVKLAIPVVKHYQSDLFHDALWIEKLTGPAEFYFIVRTWGTHIGTDFDIVKAITNGNQNDENMKAYKVNLTCEDRTWYVRFTII